MERNSISEAAALECIAIVVENGEPVDTPNGPALRLGWEIVGYRGNTIITYYHAGPNMLHDYHKNVGINPTSSMKPGRLQASRRRLRQGTRHYRYGPHRQRN